MNIQARKLVLIEEFLRISDESVLTKLESFFEKEKITKGDEMESEPMSLDKFYEMIDKSKQDSEEGLVVPHEELKEKIKTWE